VFWKLSVGSAVEDGKVIHEVGDNTPMFHLVCVINRGSYVIRREHGRGTLSASSVLRV